MNKLLGQYFTTNIELQETIYRFILNNSDKILEPCIGLGNLVEYIRGKYKQQEKNVIFDMFEIDKNLKTLECIDKNKVIWENFLEYNIENKYTTILGNPPYIKTSKGNVYIDFIIKCFNLLTENGELIFVVPSDFFKLKSASNILNTMMENGTFTHIYHPHSERLFKEARIDVLVFRYCKNKSLEKKCKYNGKSLYIWNNKGFITFHKTKFDYVVTFKEIFDIYVGMASGRDSIYKNEELGNIKIMVKENVFEKFILINKFPCKNEKINNYLLKNKDELICRKIKKYNETNWFEWGALRNVDKMKISSNEKNECIYVYNLTRNKNIAFKGKITYFGSQMLMLRPKNESIDIDKVINYLNSMEFKQNFVFCGRFKIGNGQLGKTFIPIQNLI